jgi:uncharacterized membrane protein YccC
MSTSGAPASAGRSRLHDRLIALARLLLSNYLTNGLAVGLGLLVISLAVYQLAGLAAAAAAAAGVVITTVSDTPTPRRLKLLQLLPAPVLGLPLFLLMQLLHEGGLELGLLLLAGSFLAVMLTAWGKRGGPLSFALIFTMVLSMATPAPVDLDQALQRSSWFAAGAALYLVWGVLATHLLNRRYRTQLLAECLLSFARLLRTQSQRFAAAAQAQALMAPLLLQQAALADQLQNARDLVLESPTTAPRQRLAAMLLTLLDARDHLLACELDLDVLMAHQAQPAMLPEFRSALAGMADSTERLAMALLLGRTAPALPDLRPQLAGLLAPAAQATPFSDPQQAPDAAGLLRNIADRVGHINDEILKLAALARGERAPELAAVRTQWQLFVSPVNWSWRPLLTLLSWRAPVLHHALRTSLAIGTGYGVALYLPWASHKYWIVLTIAVVMRASLAQTVQRGHARVAGTLLGCLVAMLILSSHPTAPAMLLLIALGTTFAHGLALRLVLVAAVASTVLGLLQSHLLLAGTSPVFAAGERLADTVLGTLLAWAFSYVLPSWERKQLPALIRRTVAAQARHAGLALALGTPAAPDLEWRLARREAYDSLSALTLATQRTLTEPRQVRPPLEPLEALQARSYQLLAQLTAVKALLLLRRSQLDLARVAPALAQAAQRIAAELSGQASAAAGDMPLLAGLPFQPSPDPLVATDLTPWLLRRLALACAMAQELRLAQARALA